MAGPWEDYASDEGQPPAQAEEKQPPARAEEGPWSAYQAQQPRAEEGPWTQYQKTEPEGGFATFGRHLVHAIPAAIAGGIAGSAVPGLGTIGGIAAGGGAALAESYLQRKATQALFPEEAERLRAGEEA